MNLLARSALIACLALTLPACKQEEAAAPAAQVKPPVARPASPDDRKAWNEYLTDIVTRNMEGVTADPYLYPVPASSDPEFQGRYQAMQDKATTDIERGIIAGNLLAFGGPESAKTADMMIAAFKSVRPGTMKDVKVIFIGDAADNDRVRAVIEPAGVKYLFIEAK